MAIISVGGVVKEFDESYIDSQSENNQNETITSDNILIPALATALDSSVTINLTIPAGTKAEREDWRVFYKTCKLASKMSIATKNVIQKRTGRSGFDVVTFEATAGRSKSLIQFTQIPLLVIQQAMCFLYTDDLQVFASTMGSVYFSSSANDTEMQLGVTLNIINISNVTSRLEQKEIVQSLPKMTKGKLDELDGIAS